MTDAAKRSGGGPLALVAVFLSAAGFAAALTCVYSGMRDLMVNSGGACASGGPYQINAEQVCTSGQIWLLMGGVFVGLFFAGCLVGASYWYCGTGIAGVGLLMWAALFGALGWNFLQLGFDPPANMSGGAGWIVCGVIFWLMALGGLIPGVMALVAYFRDSDKPERERSTFSEPLVRANVPFVRSMPGDPAFGSTNPGASPTNTQEQAPERAAGVDSGFIDPVTGERHGGDDNG